MNSGVELRDAASFERHPCRAVPACSDEQLVFFEVEIDLEQLGPKRDRRGGQATLTDVERRVPIVVLRRTELQSNLPLRFASSDAASPALRAMSRSTGLATPRRSSHRFRPDNLPHVVTRC